MADPHAWALVVGIDAYDLPSVPRLEGAVADAIAEVGWLRRIGVPDAQILLHAVPSAARQGELEALGLPWKDATERSIWSSVNRLTQVTGGSRLFVFLSGHGLFEASAKRLFLTQEFGVDNAWSNLGLEPYIDRFLSMDFPLQFLVMDGCQNLPYPEAARSYMAAGLPGGVRADATNRRPANRMVACYAAGQGQKAWEIDGRGAFTRRLLEAIDDRHPDPRAIELDFTTGLRWVDLEAAVREVVSLQVEKDGRAQKEARIQTPVIETLGGAVATDAARLFSVAGPEPVEVRLDIVPAHAVPDVRTVRVSVDEEAFHTRSWPDAATDAVEPPIIWRMPPALPLEVDIKVRPGAPWVVLPGLEDLRSAPDQALTAQLARVGGVDEGPVSFGVGGPAVPTDGAGSWESGYAVKVFSADGWQFPGVLGHYDAIEETLGIASAVPASMASHGPGSPWLPVAPGIRMQRHEDGPEFLVGPGQEEPALGMLRSWADAIRELVPTDLSVRELLPAVEPQASVRVVVWGGARRLAGPLASQPTVTIGRPGARRAAPGAEVARLSLEELVRDPIRDVDPGPVEVSVTLPWGTWSDTVRASATAPVTVRLPRSIGTPPLRVRLVDQLSGAGGLLLGFGQRPRSALLLGMRGTDGSVELPSVEPGAARWAYRIPWDRWEPGRPALVRLDGARIAFIPVDPGVGLAIDWSGRGVRVEPLSDVVSSAWDVLLSTGRLDADLAGLKWFDPVLGLAGAYAVYARADWTHLRTITRNLAGISAPGIDGPLLAMAARRAGRTALARGDAARLRAIAEGRSIPILRWGIPLALDLVRAAGLRSSPWRDDLERATASLSALSTWTAWSEKRARTGRSARRPG